MIHAPADRGASSKSAVFGDGFYDGARRNHFFQSMTTNWEGRASPSPDVPTGTKPGPSRRRSTRQRHGEDVSGSRRAGAIHGPTIFDPRHLADEVPGNLPI